MRDWVFVMLIFQTWNTPGAFGQADSLENYRVLASVLDDFYQKVDFNYYYPEPIDERSYFSSLHRDSLYVWINSETYEEEAFTGKELDSIYLAEYELAERLFALRSAQQHTKIILFGTFPEDDLRKNISNLDFSNKLTEAGINLSGLSPYYWNVNLFDGQNGFTYIKISGDDSSHFKYLICGAIHVSNVVFNERMDYALVEFGWHHSISNGPTGGGVHILLSKINTQWKVVKTQGLWEE